MSKLAIYEPAMCCSTGLCGVGVNSELLRISTVLNSLLNHGIEVDRFNLTTAPMKFIENAIINQLINDKGVDALPATVLDGEIILVGRYPTNAEIAEYLHVPMESLNDQPKLKIKFRSAPEKASGCACSDGKRDKK